MSDDKGREWYSVRDVYEMHVELRRAIGELRQELDTTRVEMKKYNDLRSTVNETSELAYQNRDRIDEIHQQEEWWNDLKDAIHKVLIVSFGFIAALYHFGIIG